MITKINPSYLMGKLNRDDSFYRINQTSENAHHDAILRYAGGVYFVIKTQTKNLKVRYKCHYNDKNISLRFAPKQAIECIVMGHSISDNQWYYLNKLDSISNNNKKSDTIFEVNTDITQNYDKYQICLPNLGVISDLELETDNKIEYEFVPCKCVLIGSSIGSFCNDWSHMNICCYMYRKYGVNICTAGISAYHTIHNDKLMQTIKNKNIKCIVVDLEHVHFNEFAKHIDLLSNNDRCKFLVISNILVKTTQQLKSKYPYINCFLPDGEWMCDNRHLNSYGMIKYAEKIIKEIK